MVEAWFGLHGFQATRTLTTRLYGTERCRLQPCRASSAASAASRRPCRHWWQTCSRSICIVGKACRGRVIALNAMFQREPGADDEWPDIRAVSWRRSKGKRPIAQYSPRVRSRPARNNGLLAGKAVEQSGSRPLVRGSRVNGALAAALPGMPIPGRGSSPDEFSSSRWPLS